LSLTHCDAAFRSSTCQRVSMSDVQAMLNHSELSVSTLLDS